MCSLSKEGEQEDGSLCGFAFANGEWVKNSHSHHQRAISGYYANHSFVNTANSLASLTWLCFRHSMLAV